MSALGAPRAKLIVSAVPKLIITYTLPKPAEKLPAGIARNWEAFIAGIRAHEKVHGDLIRQMVKEIGHGLDAHLGQSTCVATSETTDLCDGHLGQAAQ